MHNGRNLGAAHLQDGRHDVDERDELRALDTVELLEGCGDDKRHMCRRFVDEETVLDLTVLSQTLAMISRQHNEGVIRNTTTAESFQKSADLGVRVGNLTQVWLARVLRTVRFGRRIRRMRVVQVHPKKEW